MIEDQYVSNCCGVGMSEDDSLCPACFEGCERVLESEEE